MKIIGLEEHFSSLAILDAWQKLDPASQDPAMRISTGSEVERRLCDVADLRIAAMDEAGIDKAVISQTSPGVQNLAAADAVALARDANNRIAEMMCRRPDRFGGFATLATPSPDEAARELERCVRELGFDGAMIFGRTGERNLDHPDFAPILETAAALRAPLYLHPQTPQAPVRAAMYDGLREPLDLLLAMPGIGWHYETGIQLVRLIVSGVFDRLPDLRIILGHWGEVVLFYLDRLDQILSNAHLPRPISEYFRTNVWVTPGGIYSQRYLSWAVDVIGADRIMCATDYPYVPNKPQGSRKLLEASALDEADRMKIASGNWERMCADIQR